MSEIETKATNWLRETEYLPAARAACAAWLPICRADDVSSGEVVRLLTHDGRNQGLQSDHGGKAWICIETGLLGSAVYWRD